MNLSAQTFCATLLSVVALITACAHKEEATYRGLAVDECDRPVSDGEVSAFASSLDVARDEARKAFWREHDVRPEHRNAIRLIDVGHCQTESGVFRASVRLADAENTTCRGALADMAINVRADQENQLAKRYSWMKPMRTRPCEARDIRIDSKAGLDEQAASIVLTRAGAKVVGSSDARDLPTLQITEHSNVVAPASQAEVWQFQQNYSARLHSGGSSLGASSIEIVGTGHSEVAAARDASTKFREYGVYDLLVEVFGDLQP